MAKQQPNKFKYTLSENGNDHDLVNSPVEWANTTIEFKRSTTYQGVIRSLSLPFTFAFKAAGILRSVFYDKFLLGLAKFKIDKLEPLIWVYSTIFKGKIDFTQFQDNVANVTVNIIEDSFNEKVDAYEDVKYNIPLVEENTVEVLLTPIPVKETADLLFGVTSDFRSDVFFGVSVINNEQHSLQASVKDVDFNHVVNPDWSTDTNFFYLCTHNCTLILALDLQMVVNAAISVTRFQIEFVKSTGEETIIYDQTLAGAAAINIQQTYTFEMNQGEKLFAYFKNVTSDNTDIGFQMVTGTMNLKYLTETAASKCNALRASYVFDQLVQYMNGKGTGGAYTPQPTQSYLLTNDLRDLVITCSNSIRKIVEGTQYSPGDDLIAGALYLVINDPITYNSINYNVNDEFNAVDGIDTFTTSGNGAVILLKYSEALNISFKGFFQSMLSFMGGDCGFGLVNNNPSIEKLSVFFSNYQMLDVGDYKKDPKIKPALDYTFNTIKVGSTDQQYDTLNGFQEVNSIQIYTSDLTSIKKELNLVSDEIRIDPYGIETLRFTPADTSASRSDNDNFGIWLRPNPEIGQTYYQPLRTEQGGPVSGIDNPESYYNWRLTPKQCLWRGRVYLASVFYKQVNLRFTSALKNANLVSIDWTGLRIAEHDDLLIANLGQPYFIPITFDLSVGLKQDALNNLNTEYGYVSFNYRDAKLKGFVLETSVDAGQNSSRDFQLLCAPDVNLAKMIQAINNIPVQ